MNDLPPFLYRLPPDPTPEQLETAYAEGLLRKAQLEHGRHYAGRCRNARIARWHAGVQAFVYMREKFGHRFPEEIRHPEDERHYDVFLAVAALDDAAVPAEARIDDAVFERRPGLER